jgi:hypothetical protein
LTNSHGGEILCCNSVSIPPSTFVDSSDTSYLDYSGDCLGAKFFYFCGDCGHSIVRKSACGCRFKFQCPFCSSRRVLRQRNIAHDVVEAMNYPVILTLTARRKLLSGRLGLYDPDFDMFNMRHLAKLRRALIHKLRYLGYKIRAWYSFMESPNHLHILMDCDHIPIDVIKSEWSEFTLNELGVESYQCDIQSLNQRHDSANWTAKYVSGYITKLSDGDMHTFRPGEMVYYQGQLIPFGSVYDNNPDHLLTFCNTADKRFGTFFRINRSEYEGRVLVYTWPTCYAFIPFEEWDGLRFTQSFGITGKTGLLQRDSCPLICPLCGCIGGFHKIPVSDLPLFDFSSIGFQDSKNPISDSYFVFHQFSEDSQEN